MTDSNDTSYYEIALTSRQVVVAFVTLLSLVLGIFLCGVWVGQRGHARVTAATHDVPALPSGDEPSDDQLANLEEFKFFNESEGSTPPPPRQAAPPPPRQAPPPPVRQEAPLVPPSSAGSTLAQDVGNGGGAAPQQATPPPPPRQAPPRQAAPPPPRQAAPPPPSQAPPPPPRQAAAPPVREGEWVVQVFSTHDEPQARKLLRQLQGDGHAAFLSTREVSGQRMFRVRVGPFKERDRAEAVSTRLRRELKLDPWVTAATN